MRGIKFCLSFFIENEGAKFNERFLDTISRNVCAIDLLDCSMVRVYGSLLLLGRSLVVDFLFS